VGKFVKRDRPGIPPIGPAIFKKEEAKQEISSLNHESVEAIQEHLEEDNSPIAAENIESYS